ncbi:hypothetical protein H311_00555, partial [Anncaliia algerae PRA109]
VFDVDRESVITKLLEGHSLPTIASLYQINYQKANSIYKRYLKTGLVFVDKRGGVRRSILTSDMKKSLISYVDSDCTKTLREMANWIKDIYNIYVSINTIDRALKKFHSTLKQITLVPKRNNSASTIDLRADCASNYRELEINNDCKDFIFLDEVGFLVVSRSGRGRSSKGESAYFL